MKVVVTGSNGFLGKHLVNFLKIKGIEIIEVDFNTGIDITNWDEFSKITGFDTLIHLASNTFVPHSFSDPRGFYLNNIATTLNALELCRINDAKIIYNSTYVYGIPQYLPIDELHSISALNPYTHSKVIGEELCEKYSGLFGIKSIIFRPFNIYGPYQNERFLIPDLFKQAITGHMEVQNPLPKRDFVFVDDILSAYEKAITMDFNNSLTFNIGSGISYSVQEIVDEIIKLTNCKSVNYGKLIRKNEIPETKADISKIKSFMNWEPDTDLINGLKITFESYK